MAQIPLGMSTEENFVYIRDQQVNKFSKGVTLYLLIARENA